MQQPNGTTVVAPLHTEVDLDGADARRAPRVSAQTAVLLISTLAVFMAFLDATVVNVAFPAIHRSFPRDPLANLSWVLNAYNITVAALLVPAGRMVDRLGRRRGFLFGVGVFLGGSVLCGIAPGLDALIAARVIQGAGAAVLIPASFSIVLAAFPPDRRAGAISAWAASGAVAAAAGPSLGGLLVQGVGWRWIFFANVIFAIGMIFAPRVLTESREPSDTTPDLQGTVLLGAGVGLLALAVVKAPDWGWTSAATLLCAEAAAVLLVLVARRSTRHPAPVIEAELFTVRSFALSNVAFLLFSAGFYALLLANVLFLTEVWHFSVLRAGFAVTPGPLAAAVAAAAGGRLAERFGPRVVAVPGMIGFALAALAYRDVGPRPDYLTHWLPVQIPSGLAIGLTLAALTTASTRDLPAARLATGTAMTACFRQIGAVLGIATLVAIVSHATPAGALGAFRTGWLLMAAVSVASIIPALGLGRAVEAVTGARRVREIPGLSRMELDLPSGRMSFRVGGEGPALLLVHGLLDDGLTWRKLAPMLATRYRVIVPDLPGHGQSGPAVSGDYSPGGHALALRELLDAAGYGPVAVLGHSLGGSVALNFAAHNPDRVARIALIAPGGFGREVHPLMRFASTALAGPTFRALNAPRVRATAEGISRLFTRVGAKGPAALITGLVGTASRLGTPEARTAFARSVASVIDRRGQSCSAIERARTWHRFPTLVLWGTSDAIIPAAHCEAVADAFPQAEIVLLERVGHHAHMLKPRVVADRVLSFLDAGSRTVPTGVAPVAAELAA